MVQTAEVYIQIEVTKQTGLNCMAGRLEAKACVLRIEISYGTGKFNATNIMIKETLLLQLTLNVVKECLPSQNSFHKIPYTMYIYKCTLSGASTYSLVVGSDQALNFIGAQLLLRKCYVTNKCNI